jgi:uncharacterized membrane protein
MAFCPNCGTEVAGQFCPKCGTNVAAGGPAASAPASSSAGLTNNLASALCYLLLPAIIFLLIEPYNRVREVRFHAWQAIGLAVVLTVFNILVGMLYGFFMLATSGLGLVMAPVLMLIHFAEVILFLYVAVKAYQGQRIVLPVIGAFAEKQA